MLPDWLCTGGGGSGDREFRKPDTWRKTARRFRGLEGQKVGRFAGKCALSLMVWGMPRLDEQRRAQTLPGCAAGTVIYSRHVSISFPFLGLPEVSVSPHVLKSCERHRISERKGSPFDWPLLKGQGLSRTSFVDCPGCLGGLGESRITELSASRALGPLEVPFRDIGVHKKGERFRAELWTQLHCSCITSSC